MPPKRVVMRDRTRAGAGQSGTIQSLCMFERREELAHVGWKRSLPLNFASGDRMHERELLRVKRLPVEREGLRARRAAPIDGIADERMTDRAQMNADLVRAPGLEPAL